MTSPSGEMVDIVECSLIRVKAALQNGLAPCPVAVPQYDKSSAPTVQEKIMQNVKRAGVALAISSALAMGVPTLANAGAGSHMAYAAHDVYSDRGVWIWRIGVEGGYHSTGKKIDNYSPTHYDISTFIWQATDKSSKWTYKGTTTGTAKAYATFVLGIVTQWVSIGLRSESDSATAYAYK
jgi:hypothetical protein